jgi:hypothetical protein
MQNSSPIFSVPASADDLVPFRRVKIGSTGAAYAGVLDRAAGTLLPGDPGDDTVSAVQGLEFGIHFATIGNGTDIAVGDELQAAADGKLVKRTTGPAVAVALEACTEEDDQIRVRYYPTDGGFRVIAAGIHTWAGGAATTDSISVVGLEATDIVLVTLVARAGTENVVLSTNDAGNDQIDLTLSANGTNGTTKLSYMVSRP